MLFQQAANRFHWKALFLPVALLSVLSARSATVSGTVTLAGTEPPQALAGVMVSDGVTGIVRTDAAGAYSLPLSEGARFVMVINPPGCEPTRDFYQALPAELPELLQRDFVLQPARRPVDTPFTFVQITDSHGSSRLPTALRIIEPINALVEQPAFVFETGDLSADDRGTDPVESYGTLLRAPYFPVTGNHDVTRSRGKPFAGWDFEQHFGPWYYAWHYGRYLFVGLPWSNREGSLDDAATWLEQLLAMNAAREKAHVIVGLHHWDGLGRPGSAQLARFVRVFRDHGVRAMFMGHWHTAQVYQAWGIPVYMSWNVAMGNRDLAAGGFRLITAEPDGTLRSSFRSAGFHQYVQVSAPAKGAVLSRAVQPIVVNAFDTAFAVRRVRATLHAAGSPEILQHLDLKQAGNSSCWEGHIAPAPTWPPDLRLLVTVTDERGEDWPGHEVTVALAEAPLPRIVPGSDWPMMQRDPQRTGVTPDTLTPPLFLSWAHATGATFGFNSPIVVGGTVYTSVDNNDEPLRPTRAVLAVDGTDGSVQWTHDLAGCSVRGGLAGNREGIYALADTGRLFALDPGNGRQRWERSDLVAEPVWNEMFNGSPVLDGTLLVAGAGAALAAYDASDGSLHWQTSVVAVGGRRWTPDPPPAIVNGKAILAWNDLHALALANGEPAWTLKHHYILTAAPTVAQGLVVTICLPPDDNRFSHNRLLTAIDVNTGEQVWQVPLLTRQRGIYSSPVMSANRVYAFDDRRLHAVDLQTGDLLWQLELPPGDVVTGSAALSGDHLYVVRSSGQILAVNVQRRDIAWSYDLGVRVDSSPAISGNALYVTARDGTLYAFVGSPQ